MTVPITPKITPNPPARAASKAPAANTPAAPTASTASIAAKTEQVQLSPAVQQLHQSKAKEAPLDEAKLAKLKKAIADGDYPIDAQKLARNMIKLDPYL